MPSNVRPIPHQIPRTKSGAHESRTESLTIANSLATQGPNILPARTSAETSSLRSSDARTLYGPSYRSKSFLTDKIRPVAGAPVAGTLGIVDIFCGCGGLTLGATIGALEQGYNSECIAAIDVDSVARSVYSKNFRPKFEAGGDIYDDFLHNNELLIQIRDRLADHDFSVLLAGPPCQGHSSLNNVSRMNDPRNDLYGAVADAAIRILPTWVIIENVPGVVRSSNNVVPETHARLQGAGYTIDSAVVDLATLGVPQRRRRHVTLAVRGTAPWSLQQLLLPNTRHTRRTVGWAIDDLADVKSTGLLDRSATLSPENLDRAQWLLANKSYDLPNHLRPHCHQDGNHSYKSMYGRLSSDEPAQTLTTGFMSPGQGRYLHPLAPRCLTPHEAARLQMFPDWFDFTEVRHRTALARLIGNAVPSTLAATLIDALIQAEHGE